jgi:hypothetical protein
VDHLNPPSEAVNGEILYSEKLMNIFPKFYGNGSSRRFLEFINWWICIHSSDAILLNHGKSFEMPQKFSLPSS